MGLLDRLRTEARDLDTTTFGNPAPWLLEALGTQRSQAGVNVTPITARGLSAAYACINVIAQDLAKLPLKIYRRLDRGRQVVHDDPRAYLLSTQPNPLMTAYTFLYTIASHALGWGNGYAEIELSEDERQILGFWPLMPHCTEPILVPSGKRWEKVYCTMITDTNGSQRQVILPGYRVLHLLGPTLDGFRGRSPISDAKQAIGLGLAAQEFGAKFFANGAHMGMVATHPGAIGAKASDRIRAGLELMSRGLENAHRIAVLEEGVKLEKIGLPQDESQFLETTKKNLSDVGRYYRMPPHKMQDLDRATNNNIEQQALEYLQDCLSPWQINLEQAYNTTIFSPKERGTLYVKFNVDAILRADSVARADANQKAILGGWMTPNEARELEEKNPLPPEQGDITILPANYTLSEKIGQQFGNPKQGASVRAACQRVLDAALGRVVRREAKAIRRLVPVSIATGKAFEEMPLDADRFANGASGALAELEPVLRSELAVVVEAFGEELLGPGFEVAFARAYVESSIEQLRAAAAAGPQAVLDRLSSWEETKAATLARLALEGEWQERS